MSNKIKEIVRNKKEVVTFDRNKQGRDFIVGDIHGQYKKLKKELESVSFDEKRDRLFSAGDLVDRGENSIEVLQWLDKEWFYPVMGNHDEFVIWCHGVALSKPFNEERWYSEMNGGAWWKDVPMDLKDLIALKLAHLPHAITVELNDGAKVGIVHADVPFKLDWASFCQKLEDKDPEVIKHCKLDRKRAYFENRPIIEGIDRVYFGHCAFENVKRKGNCVYVDTGASYETYAPESDFYKSWGRLSVIELK